MNCSANRFSEELTHSAKERYVFLPVKAVLIAFSDLFRFNEGLLGDEDTIEEFTLILCSYFTDLLNLGAAEGDCLVVNAVENQLTLLIFGVAHGSSTSHVDNLVLLASEEVLDSNGRTVLGYGDVDGEVSVYKSHFVAEAL